MITRTKNTALILVLVLAGCGGSGIPGEESAAVEEYASESYPEFVATTYDDGRVELQWDEEQQTGSSADQQYVVYRARQVSGIFDDYVEVGRTTQSSFVDITAIESETYSYAVVLDVNEESGGEDSVVAAGLVVEIPLEESSDLAVANSEQSAIVTSNTNQSAYATGFASTVESIEPPVAAAIGETLPTVETSDQDLLVSSLYSQILASNTTNPVPEVVETSVAGENGQGSDSTNAVTDAVQSSGTSSASTDTASNPSNNIQPVPSETDVEAAAEAAAAEAAAEEAAAAEAAAAETAAAETAAAEEPAAEEPAAEEPAAEEPAAEAAAAEAAAVEAAAVEAAAAEAAAAEEAAAEAAAAEAAAAEAAAAEAAAAEAAAAEAAAAEAAASNSTNSAARDEEIFQCVNQYGGPLYTKSFEYQGVCTNVNDSAGCYYYDYRSQNIANGARFDQRGVEAYQVTYPQATHRWRAFYFDEQSSDNLCWSGGAHIGRNPLAMTWGGNTGTKSRKNNFAQIDGGSLTIEGVRLHNIHDPFYVGSNHAELTVSDSWVSWNRDDFFEGFLHNLTIKDTLVDGTYAFLSDPDGSCNSTKDAGNSTLVIENSLIRVQHMPGPYGSPSDKWHWKIEGGHGQLWKTDSCGWSGWPKFILKNNVFLVEGSYTTRYELNAGKCDNGLPGACNDTALSQLTECQNNLFLYTQYDEMKDSGVLPGPTPGSNSPYYNSSNPNFLPNGTDCYQRMTDDASDVGYGDVMATWRAKRQQWIDRHTGHSDQNKSVMTIPGVDYSVFDNSSTVSIKNRNSGLCLQSNDNGSVSMASCSSNNARQQFDVVTRNDGRLIAAVLLRTSQGGYLRSQDALALEIANSSSPFDGELYWEHASSFGDEFSERFYIYPLGNEPGGASGYYAIESDAIMRSFVMAQGSTALVQHVYAGGSSTPLPQAEFDSGNDFRLQWEIIEQ